MIQRKDSPRSHEDHEEKRFEKEHQNPEMTPHTRTGNETTETALPPRKPARISLNPLFFVSFVASWWIL